MDSDFHKPVKVKHPLVVGHGSAYTRALLECFAVATAIGATTGGYDIWSEDEAWEREKRHLRRKVNPKCALPGCEQESNRGGYCSADHCREHRERQRNERSKTSRRS